MGRYREGNGYAAEKLLVLNVFSKKSIQLIIAGTGSVRFDK